MSTPTRPAADAGPALRGDANAASTVTERTVRRRADALAALVGLAVVVPCGLLARSGTVGPGELAVFHAINGLPDVLSPIMRGAQLLGILLVGPVAAAIAASLRRWRLALACLLVTAGKLFAERMVWELVQRSRPGSTISDAIVRGDTPASGASFVSGHVVLLTGLAWVATPYLRGRWRSLPWAVVALVAFARIYLGAHAPLDVVGGVGLGLIVGAVASLIAGVTTGESRPGGTLPAPLTHRSPERPPARWIRLRRR